MRVESRCVKFPEGKSCTTITMINDKDEVVRKAHHLSPFHADKMRRLWEIEIAIQENHPKYIKHKKILSKLNVI